MAVTKARSLREDALELAELGLRVFPLNGKTPIGGNGCLDATTDKLQIESWWERYPKANIGLATGKGVAVIDVDVRRDGKSSLDELRSGHRPDFDTVRAKTGGGGWHFFFGVKKDMWVPNSKDRIGRGVEVLYDGRYVVAPPSVHPITGNTYRWLRDPGDYECRAMPEWLCELNVKESGKGSWDKYVEEIKEGEGRDNHLASYAGSLRRGGATEGEILNALMARNERVCNPPMSIKDLERIAHSIARYKPEDIMVTASLDDSGNGKRLASFVEGRAIHVAELGWFTWTGRRWRQDVKDLRIQNKAKEIAPQVKRAAVDVKQNEELSKRLFALGMRSGSAAAIKNMTNLAADEPEVGVQSGQLDRNPWAINLVNGTFDLREGTLREQDPKDLLTQMARVEYDEDAVCPRWDDFLAQILPDGEIAAYVQRAIGYSLTGLGDEQCFFLMYGTGSNGKSTFVETIKYLLGNYAWKMASGTVIGNRTGGGGSAATPDIVALRGRRFVVAAESGNRQHFDEPTIKDLTGKDTLQARALYKAPIEFVPEFKLWMYSNYKPVVRGMDIGIWRRIRLVPFTAHIDRPDKRMGDRMRVELPGIFNWALRGFYEWEKYGLNEPEAIKEEVAEYQSDMDVVSQFVVDKCAVGAEYMASAATLWEEFKEWQNDLPRSEWVHKRDFTDRLRNLGYHKSKRVVKTGQGQIAAISGLKLKGMH